MLPRSYSGRFDTGPSHRNNGSVRDEESDEEDEEEADAGQSTATTTMMQDPRARSWAAPRRADVHYAVVQCLSHPRPVVLQLRATLHITAENKSLRNRARPRHDGAREGAARCTRGGIKLLPRLFLAMISLLGRRYRDIDHRGDAESTRRFEGEHFFHRP